MRTCYYELLEVQSTATDNELKKAYRKKALQLHPDKNPHDIKGSTERFALIKSAYDVLSDPNERSWYDSHKSQILRDDDDFSSSGNGNGGNGDYEDELVIPSISVEEIMRYFNPTMYTKFDDSLIGFYNIVGRLFERLASEEIIHGKYQGISEYNKFKDDSNNINVLDPSLLKFPRFGNSSSDYTTSVRVFYNSWLSFQSIKSFNWKDEYRYSSAPDRRTRRIMERENKKARDIARKEYNETVRSFVSFIKKRDPRVKRGIENFEKEKKLKQQEILSRQAKEISLQEKMANIENFKIQDWQKLDIDELADLEEMLKNEYSISSSSSDSEFDDFKDQQDENFFECFICNKFFKSEKQFQSHEVSNKHKKLVKQLKWEMKQEGLDLGIDKDDIDLDEFETAESDVYESNDNDEDSIKSDAEFVSGKDNDKNDSEINDINNNVNINEINEKDKKLDLNLNDNIDDFEVDNDVSENEDDLSISENQTEDKQPQSQVTGESEDQLNSLEAQLSDLGIFSKTNTKNNNIIDDDDDDWNLDNKKQKKKKNKKKSNVIIDSNNSLSPSVSTEIDNSTTNDNNIPKQKISSGSEICVVCKEIFSSRNKLFQHVKTTGHAAPVKESKKKSKKRK